MKKYLVNPESNQILCNTVEEAYKAVGGRIDLDVIRGMENDDMITDGTETESQPADFEIVCTEENIA